MAASIAIGVVGGVGGTSYLATSCKHNVRNTIQAFVPYKKKNYGHVFTVAQCSSNPFKQPVLQVGVRKRRLLNND